MNRDLPGSKVFRGIFYLPTICTGVAMYITWTYLFNGTNGYFNVLLNRIGLEGTNWLGNTSTAMGSIIFMEMFNIGTAMTIVLLQVCRMFQEISMRQQIWMEQNLQFRNSSK
ncbi:MAG: carbohydrate ABC transporter permease [Blautia faecis]